MPKQKNNNKRGARDNDSDDEMDGTQATQTQSLTQAEKAAATVSKEELERKANDLVQYLLIADQKKVPIKRQEINKNVLKESSKMFPVLIEKAKQKLNQVFGVELIELEGKPAKYILVNKYETDTENAHLQWSAMDNGRMGLLMVILSVIFMSGNTVQDSLIWHTLKKLGLEQDQEHEQFGDVKKLVTGDFVRTGYLEYIRHPLSDPPTYEFEWGQRAKHEITKRNILDFVCQIYGDMNPEDWTSQIQEINRSEGLETNAEAAMVE